MSPTLERECWEYCRENGYLIHEITELGLWYDFPVSLSGGGRALSTGLATWETIANNLGGVTPMKEDTRHDTM